MLLPSFEGRFWPFALNIQHEFDVVLANVKAAFFHPTPLLNFATGGFAYHYSFKWRCTFHHLKKTTLQQQTHGCLCRSAFLGAASPFCVRRQGAPGTRELKISSVLGEETHTEVRRCEESNRGFQGARACVAKGLRPPHLNNRPEDKNFLKKNKDLGVHPFMLRPLLFLKRIQSKWKNMRNQNEVQKLSTILMAECSRTSPQE